MVVDYTDWLSTLPFSLTSHQDARIYLFVYGHGFLSRATLSTRLALNSEQQFSCLWLLEVETAGVVQDS